MKKIIAILISLLFAVATLSSVSGFCGYSDNVCHSYCMLCVVSPCS
ncbi:MAG: hypothetical protein GKC00_04920, partial [Candidatus Methanofastidiosa archaeon]|nr:hypothetical protein [Candidatus Methanofastidiosa archaeon]